MSVDCEGVVFRRFEGLAGGSWAMAVESELKKAVIGLAVGGALSWCVGLVFLVGGACDGRPGTEVMVRDEEDREILL